MYFSTPEILIVEDEEFNREIMALRLQSCNYDLRFAVDGQQALDMVKEKKPDIVLLDIMLPEIMGLQVLHTLRQQYSMVELPIIMVTAIDQEQRIIRALELGANDYVPKPTNFPILIARLQTQLSLKQLSALNNEFLATASYDLRKPIAMIQNITAESRLKVASNQPFDNQELMQKLNAVAQSASYMDSIVECIINTQAGGFGQIRLTKIPLQVETLISETINRHIIDANEKQIILTGKLTGSSPTIEVDRSRITQILDNLVENAIKFCSAGDSVTVSTKVDGDFLFVIVSDNGPGLKESDFQNLFLEKGNATTQPTNEDTSDHHIGLGLSICKQLIELHDGEIDAMNNNDKGVTFWFKLPVFKLKPV